MNMVALIQMTVGVSSETLMENTEPILEREKNANSEFYGYGNILFI
jgi:hypothetical protein